MMSRGIFQAMTPNRRVQATPGSALGEFVAAWHGAPDPGRYPEENA